MHFLLNLRLVVIRVFLYQVTDMIQTLIWILWWSSLSYRNQSIHLPYKSIDLILNDMDSGVIEVLI